MLIPIGDDNVTGGHPPLVSYGLLFVNIALFAVPAIFYPDLHRVLIAQYGAVPCEISTGQYVYTLLTSTFLHGSWSHLLGNMLFLWIFADNIESTVGSARFAIFYTAGALVASVLQVSVSPYSEIPIIGASGAIAAVMGAYILMFPRSRVRMTFFLLISFYIPAWVFLGIWFIQQVSSGLGLFNYNDAGGIAWWAHIGGFLLGLIYGVRWRGYVSRA